MRTHTSSLLLVALICVVGCADRPAPLPSAVSGFGTVSCPEIMVEPICTRGWCEKLPSSDATRLELERGNPVTLYHEYAGEGRWVPRDDPSHHLQQVVEGEHPLWEADRLILCEDTECSTSRVVIEDLAALLGVESDEIYHPMAYVVGPEVWVHVYGNSNSWFIRPSDDGWSIQPGFYGHISQSGRVVVVLGVGTYLAGDDAIVEIEDAPGRVSDLGGAGIWATSHTDVWKYERSKWVEISRPDAIGENEFIGRLFTDGVEVWLLSGAGIHHYHQDGWELIADGEFAHAVYHEGVIWAATSDTAVVCVDRESQSDAVPVGVARASVHEVVNAHELLFSTSRNIVQLVGDELLPVAPLDVQLRSRARASGPDNLWSVDTHVRRYVDGEWLAYIRTEVGYTQSDEPVLVFPFASDDVWVSIRRNSTNVLEFARFDGSTWTRVGADFTGHKLWRLDGSYWAQDFISGELKHLGGSDVTVIPAPHEDARIHLLGADFVAVQGTHVWHLEGAQWQSLPDVPMGYHPQVAGESVDEFWVYSPSGGFRHFSDGEWEQIELERHVLGPNPPNDWVVQTEPRGLVDRPDGSIWLIMPDGQILRREQQ